MWRHVQKKLFCAIDVMKVGADGREVKEFYSSLSSQETEKMSRDVKEGGGGKSCHVVPWFFALVAVRYMIKREFED